MKKRWTKEGYSGVELLNEFKSRQAKVKPAVKKLLESAAKAAKGEESFFSYEDVFGGKEDS